MVSRCPRDGLKMDQDGRNMGNSLHRPFFYRCRFLKSALIIAFFWGMPLIGKIIDCPLSVFLIFWGHFGPFLGSGSSHHRPFLYRCRAQTYRFHGLNKASGLLWVILGFFRGARTVPGSPHDGFKMAKDGLKMAKDDPMMALRWATMASRWPRDAPG
jgi:Zn-dependent protease